MTQRKENDTVPLPHGGLRDATTPGSAAANHVEQIQSKKSTWASGVSQKHQNVDKAKTSKNETRELSSNTMHHGSKKNRSF